MKKLLLIITILASTSVVNAQNVSLNSDTQELFIKINKKSESTKQGRLLQAIISNSEYIQLKDGTIISVKDLSGKFDQASGVDSGDLQHFENALKRVTGGEGTGTGSGG